MLYPVFPIIYGVPSCIEDGVAYEGLPGVTQVVNTNPKDNPDYRESSPPPTFYINGARGNLPYSLAARVRSGLDRSKMDFARGRAYKTEDTVQDTPFQTGSQNVDVFGGGRTTIFQFRRPGSSSEEQALRATIDSDVPLEETVRKCVDTTIWLRKKADAYGEERWKTIFGLESTPAPQGSVGPVEFYLLTQPNHVVRHFSADGQATAVAPKTAEEQVLVTYPIHPDIDPRKTADTAGLLHRTLGEKLGLAVRLENLGMPIEMDHPDTIYKPSST